MVDSPALHAPSHSYRQVIVEIQAWLYPAINWESWRNDANVQMKPITQLTWETPLARLMADFYFNYAFQGGIKLRIY